MSTETSSRIPILDLDRPRARRGEQPDALFGPDGEMLYPDSDGRLMAENTLQAEWISLIKTGLDLLYRDDPDVFVAADLLWYPVKGRNTRRLAPDSMVAFGRPKGYRGSYMQWAEAGVPPQVAFEIWSPGNRRRALQYKLRFYERYGVEEYYHFDPYKIRLDGWIKEGEAFRAIPQISGWVSPRLGIRFELAETLTIFAPDGQPFLSNLEIARQRDQFDLAAREANAQAAHERQAAVEAKARAERERQAAVEANAQAARERQAAVEAKARAEREGEAAREAIARAERMAARLRELGIDPEA